MSAVVAGGASSTAIDLRTRRIPNVLTGAIALAGVGIAAGGFGPVTLPQAIAGLLVGFLVMLPGHVIGATGAGDVKLFAAKFTVTRPVPNGTPVR